jgi:hypothetical protein
MKDREARRDAQAAAAAKEGPLTTSEVEREMRSGGGGGVILTLQPWKRSWRSTICPQSKQVHPPPPPLTPPEQKPAWGARPLVVPSDFLKLLRAEMSSAPEV